MLSEAVQVTFWSEPWSNDSPPLGEVTLTTGGVWSAIVNELPLIAVPVLPAASWAATRTSPCVVRRLGTLHAVLPELGIAVATADQLLPPSREYETSTFVTPTLSEADHVMLLE